MIPQRNISLLSNRLARAGGRRIPETVLERDYCLAWFLTGLAQAPLRENLLFKGGTALKRCYFADYRFSEDLDFTLEKPLSLDSILAGLEDVYKIVRNASGVVFRHARADRKQHLNSHTFYLGYEGPLPSLSAKEVKVDITIDEKIVTEPTLRPVLRGYPEYSDLPEANMIRVYSLAEIAVEKVAAITDRARSEPRDLYDIWHLTSGGDVDLLALTLELGEKFAFRGRKCEAMIDALEQKKLRYKKLWDARLAPQMTELPPFDHVYRSVCRTLRAVVAQRRFFA